MNELKITLLCHQWKYEVHSESFQISIITTVSVKVSFKFIFPRPPCTHFIPWLLLIIFTLCFTLWFNNGVHINFYVKFSKSTAKILEILHMIFSNGSCKIRQLFLNGSHLWMHVLIQLKMKSIQGNQVPTK